MRAQEIIKNVKSLKLPKDSYVVFGSCPMTIAGIREANDIDLLVTSDVLEQLKAKGWKEYYKAPGDEPLVSGVYEAHDNWNFSAYSPTLEHLLASAKVVEGVPFASLKEVLKWKLASNSPKFQKDAKLIDEYLQES